MDKIRKYVVSIMILDEEPEYVDLLNIRINPKTEGNRLLETINQGLELVHLEKVKGFHYRQEDNDISWVNSEDIDVFYRQTEYAFRHREFGKHVPKKDRWARIIIYHDDSI